MGSTVLAQPDTLDTYDRLFALRDSLRSWAHFPPTDIIASPDLDNFAEYFPDATIESLSDTSFIIQYPPYMEMNWGGLHGRWENTGLQWTPSETSISYYEASRLAWLRTLPLPASLRATNPNLPDTVAWVLHGRDIDHISMAAYNTTATLAWMAREKLVLAGSLKIFDEDTGSFQESTDVSNFEILLLITTPGSEIHHVIIWDENQGQVEINLRPFIPTSNVSELFAASDTLQHYDKQFLIGSDSLRDED